MPYELDLEQGRIFLHYAGHRREIYQRNGVLIRHDPVVRKRKRDVPLSP